MGITETENNKLEEVDYEEWQWRGGGRPSEEGEGWVVAEGSRGGKDTGDESWKS